MKSTWKETSLCKAIGYLVLLCLLAACKSETEKSASNSQTIAKASGVEITIHELKHGLSGAKTSIENERRFLESMVDQTLMAKKATEAGLDKDPKIMMTISAARRAILAQAMAEKIAGATITPTELESRKYYDRYPNLFENRRLYEFREFGVSTKQVALEKVRDATSAAKSIEQSYEKLKDATKNTPIVSRTNATEDLPVELVEAFNRMKPGALGIIAMPSQTQVVQLLSVRMAPLSFPVARPAIDNLLASEAKRSRLASAVDGYRKESSIEYFGEYAKVAQMSFPGGKPAPSATNPAQIDKQNSPKSDVTTPKPSGPKSTGAVTDRGVAGL